MSYSVSSPFPTQEQPYRIQPVEMVPPPQPFSADRAAQELTNSWNRYEHPYAHAIREMFNQADQNPAVLMPQSEREMYGNDADILQEVISFIDDRLDESDAVKKIRREDYKPESSHDFKNVFQAFDRARDVAFKKIPMSTRQRIHFIHATKSELDWSFRDLFINGECVDAEDALIMGAKGSKKIKYLTDSKKIIGVLRRSGGLQTRDAIRNRLQADRAVLNSEAHRPEVQAALNDEETQKLFSQIEE